MPKGNETQWEPMSFSLVANPPDPACVIVRRIKKPTHSLSDLDQLARHWPLLFGKALDPSAVTGVQGLVLSRSGRLDHIDEKSPEIQRAIKALDRLYELYEAEETRQAAQVLLYSRVVCGVDARMLGSVYLQIALAYRSAPKKMTPTKETALIGVGKRLYDLACMAYRKVAKQ